MSVTPAKEESKIPCIIHVLKLLNQYTPLLSQTDYYDELVRTARVRNTPSDLREEIVQETVVLILPLLTSFNHPRRNELVKEFQSYLVSLPLTSQALIIKSIIMDTKVRKLIFDSYRLA